MEKKIEILISENDAITINTYNVQTGEMVKTLASIVLSHAQGNYTQNFIKVGS